MTTLTHGIVWLVGAAAADDAFAAQCDQLAGRTQRLSEDPDKHLDELVDATSGQTPAVHVVADPVSAASALELAARHFDKVTSLVLVDPEVNATDTELRDTMREVRVPTLVMVSAPTPETTFAGAQSVAGTVDNGVMVIIDDVEPPAHHTAAESVTEWLWPFLEISEGLYQLRPLD